jgi:hypothetical protein
VPGLSWAPTHGAGLGPGALRARLHDARQPICISHGPFAGMSR